MQGQSAEGLEEWLVKYRVTPGPAQLIAKALCKALKGTEVEPEKKRPKVVAVVPSGVIGAGQGVGVIDMLLSAESFPQVRMTMFGPSWTKSIPWHGDGDDPNIRCVTLPEHMTWLTLKSRHLFVRSCYQGLWQMIDEKFCIYKDTEIGNREERILVLGNTGIGKTVALNYFLKQALEKGYRVLFETRGKRFYFHDGIMEWEDLWEGGLRAVRSDSSVLFLVDHEIEKSPPCVEAFTMAPVSPNPVNYEEWGKNRCSRLWVQLTTEAEFDSMNSVEPLLSDPELRRRLDLYGPIPRVMFQFDQESCELMLRTKIVSLDYGACRKLGVFMSGELPESKHGLSCWWVLRVTTNNLKGPTNITWATKDIMSKVLERYRGQHLRELEAEIAVLLNDPRIACA